MGRVAPPLMMTHLQNLSPHKLANNKHIIITNITCLHTTCVHVHFVSVKLASLSKILM